MPNIRGEHRGGGLGKGSGGLIGIPFLIDSLRQRAKMMEGGANISSDFLSRSLLRLLGRVLAASQGNFEFSDIGAVVGALADETMGHNYGALKRAIMAQVAAYLRIGGRGRVGGRGGGVGGVGGGGAGPRARFADGFHRAGGLSLLVTSMEYPCADTCIAALELFLVCDSVCANRHYYGRSSIYSGSRLGDISGGNVDTKMVLEEFGLRLSAFPLTSTHLERLHELTRDAVDLPLYNAHILFALFANHQRQEKR